MQKSKLVKIQNYHTWWQ